MQTQSIFQVGNSHVISIPSHLMKELGFKKGQKLIVEKSPDMEGIIAKPVSINVKSQSKISGELKKWLNSFQDEDGEILDELATR